MLPAQVQNMSPADRLAFLRDNAYKVEEGKFFKKFLPDELVSLKETFSQQSLALADKKAEFKQISADFKGRIKTMSEEAEITLQSIRGRGVWKKGDTFMFDDQEGGFMYIYDAEGNEIERRKLRPDEKQTSMLTAARGGEQH